MSIKAYAPCQCCSALGVVGERCGFCGSTIVAKDETRQYTNLVIKRRNIAPDVFAERISKYHRVGEFIHNVAVVSIGKLHGVINKNGELILPVEYSYAKMTEKSLINLRDENGNCIFDLDSGHFLSYADGNRFPYHCVSYGVDGQIVYKYICYESVFDLNMKKVIMPASCEYEFVVRLGNGYACGRAWDNYTDYMTREGELLLNPLGVDFDVCMANDHINKMIRINGDWILFSKEEDPKSKFEQLSLLIRKPDIEKRQVQPTTKPFAWKALVGFCSLLTGVPLIFAAIPDEMWDLLAISIGLVCMGIFLLYSTIKS